MSFKLAYSASHQPHAPVRWDSVIAAGVVELFHQGDIACMDRASGTSSFPRYGEDMNVASFPDGGLNAQITIGAAGTAGSLPLGSCTVANGGLGYGFDPTANYDAQATGNGLATPAIVQFQTSTVIHFTGALAAATSGTLTGALAEGNGKFWFGFSDGSRRLVTVTGTACAWTGAVTANAAANYSQGGNASFTGALTAATSGTLTGTLSKGNGFYLFNFSDGSTRVVKVTGTAVTWNSAVTATASVSYADGAVVTATVVSGGLGATNVGSANFGLANWNGTSGYIGRRLAAIMSANAWKDLSTARAAGKLKFTAMPDDRERALTWDWSLNSAPWPCQSLGDVLHFWRTVRTGISASWGTYFDNFAAIGNGDIPSSMTGVTDNLSGGVIIGADIPNWYTRQDYDDYGNAVGSPGAGPLAVTVIKIDCVAAKSPQSDANTSAKLMIGALQEAQFKADCLAAKTAGVKAIIGMSGKDFFNADNSDGWGAFANANSYPTYTTARDRLLQWCDDNAIPIVWMTGDRACWSASVTQKANGVSTYDHLSVCASPLGSLNTTAATLQNGNTPYPQMLTQGRKRDQCVYGMITWDSVNQQVIQQILDNADDTEQFACGTPAGARVPSWWRQARQA